MLAAGNPALTRAQRESSLEGLLADFTAEQFDEVWRLVMDPDTSGRLRGTASYVLQRYADMGHFPEALERAKSLAPGGPRSECLRDLFSHANMPLSEQLALLRGLTSQADRKAVALGMGRAHSVQFLNESYDSIRTDFSALDKLSPLEADLLKERLHLQSSLAQRQGEEAFQTAMNQSIAVAQSLIDQGKVPVGFMKSMMGSAGAPDPFAYLQANREKLVELFPEDAGIPRGVVENMSFQNRSQTMDVLASAGNSTGLDLAMIHYLDDDSLAANAWVEKNRSRLSEAQMQAVEVARFKFQLLQEDLPAAGEVLERIKDPAVRADLALKLHEKQTDGDR